MWPDSVFACTALSSHTVQQENAQVNFNVLIFDENGPDGLLWKIRFRTAFLQDSLFRTERRSSVDRCTSLGLRVDIRPELSAAVLADLAHAYCGSKSPRVHTPSGLSFDCIRSA